MKFYNKVRIDKKIQKNKHYYKKKYKINNKIFNR